MSKNNKIPLKVQIIPVTPFQQNCSLVWHTDTMEGVLIDPGGDVDTLLKVIKDHGVNLVAMWLTHGHLDHAGGAKAIRDQLEVPIIGPHKDDQFWLDLIEESWARYGHQGLGQNVTPDRYLEHGETLALGDIEFKVVHTPGHTPGHVVIYNDDIKLAFVGDVLFQGSIGRTDFPKGDFDTLINSIRSELWPLGNDMNFVPGHGPMSTFGAERASNPFVGDNVIGAKPKTGGVM